MKKFLFSLFLFPFFLFAQAPAGYYDGTDGLTGYQLKSKLNQIISKNFNSHYGELRDIYFVTDLDQFYDHGTENTTTVVDIYSEIPDGPDYKEFTRADLQSSTSPSAEGQYWNREHMIPSSFFDEGSREQYPMYSDLFTVIPVDGYINQRRSNFSYGTVNTPTMIFRNGSKLGINSDARHNYTVFEPIDEFKGDVARALLYFAVRYEGKLGNFNFSRAESMFDGTEEKAFKDWILPMLLEWHALDKVSARELDRNNKVYEVQRNRNPFIDHPEFVDMIWKQSTDAVAPSAPTALSASQISSNFIKLEWPASTETDVIGYKIYNNGLYIGYSNTNSFYADGLNPSTTYNFTVSAYDSSNNISVKSNNLTATTITSDSFAKDLIITKYIEGTGYNKAIEITNKTGHPVNLNEYRIRVQFRGTTFYYSDYFVLDGVIANGESVVIMHSLANLGCFSIDQARFVSTSPVLTFGGTQRIELLRRDTTVDAVGYLDTNNSLADKSLYRLDTVQHPTSNYTASEWQTYGLNYCEELGTLASDEVEITGNEIIIYPNPVTQGVLFANGKEVQLVERATFYDMTGRMIKTEVKPFRNKNSMDVSSLQSGAYILQLDNKSFKFIKK